ncbi:formate dehydrogenase accessory sulfurtransferase FdhD [Evansella halocellulosilytica]|uniref:formate dehydrogenase accessory sulfurtransferase FdhD n=1 Tax=Evansella halocellulosilytica TaxID=2011013 RepID=UPI000BB81247|nr:formate dehydrogenase accessory sulfurtransferase FdhD [Evansella halocellulosilytica]
MEHPISSSRQILKYTNENFQSTTDEIVSEFPLTIYVNDEEFATMVCTPAHFEEMVYGFLASEGVIRFKEDVKQFTLDESKGFAYVDLHAEHVTSQKQYSKRFIGSCCGKSRQFYFHNDATTAKTSRSNVKLSAAQCIYLMKSMQEQSNVFQKTGGVHNAALCDASKLIITRTDIGRHNALDKLYGHALLNRMSIRDKVLVFSGRISSEVLLKAAKIGVGIVLSKSAPTDLAIELAEDLNITAVGFIRGQSFNVYSHPERIIQA